MRRKAPTTSSPAVTVILVAEAAVLLVSAARLNAITPAPSARIARGITVKSAESDGVMVNDRVGGLVRGARSSGVTGIGQSLPSEVRGQKSGVRSQTVLLTPDF